jgi:hypothetical protein
VFVLRLRTWTIRIFLITLLTALGLTRTFSVPAASASCSASNTVAATSGTGLVVYAFLFSPRPTYVLATGVNFSLFNGTDITNASYSVSGSDLYEDIWFYNNSGTSHTGLAYVTYC